MVPFGSFRRTSKIAPIMSAEDSMMRNPTRFKVVRKAYAVVFNTQAWENERRILWREPKEWLPFYRPAGRFLLVHRLAYNGDVVAFKIGRRQGARRAHI
jgi:hypothetical protein